MYAYTVIMRAEDDPERTPRPKKGGGRKDKTPHNTVKKMDAGQIRIALLQHMQDGKPRTFHRIGVELWDMSSATLFQSKVETELWQLVVEGELEFTMEAPVLFRRRERRSVVSNKSEKHTCPMEWLFDINGGNNTLRKKLIEGGAKMSKGVWTFASEDQFSKTMELLGRAGPEMPDVETGKLPEPEAVALPPEIAKASPDAVPLSDFMQQSQAGQRFASDRENVANTPKSLPSEVALPDAAPPVLEPKTVETTVEEAVRGGLIVQPQTEQLPTTNGSLAAAVGAAVAAEAPGSIVDTPAGPAAVVETGDVASGGLLERDEAGNVRKLSLLQLKPNRLVCIETRVAGLRQRRTLGKRKQKNEGEEGRYGGLETVTTTTTSEQTIVLPEENKRAEILRSNLRGVLERMGTSLKGGFVAVPLEAEAAFMEQLAAVKRELKEFNAGTQVWKVFIDATRYQAMGDDGENAARKLAYELKLLTDEVKQALDECDTARIQAITRDMKAKSLALAPGQAKLAVENTITEARSMRSMMVREVEKKGRAISEIKSKMRTDIVESTRLMLDTFEVPEEVSGMDTGTDAGRLAGIIDSGDGGNGGEPVDGGDGEDGGNGSVADGEQMGLGLAGRFDGVLPVVPS
jgi:hypothetical protein